MKTIVEDNIYIEANLIENPTAHIWCIHGFGDSGRGFKEIFDSKLPQTHNIYVPDLPGFGKSPYDNGDIHSGNRKLLDIIKKISPGKDIVILAHSLGGILGTWICKTLNKQIKAFINIEGNLTLADTFITAIAAKAQSPAQFLEYMEKNIFKKSKGDRILEHYRKSISSADPDALIEWGKSGLETTKNASREFKDLKCRKIYIWGDKSAPMDTRNYLKENSIPEKLFPGCGHCPMIEKASVFYSFVEEFISEA